MPALPPYLIEPVWQQFLALLPPRAERHHPLGCHRSRIEDRVVFEKLCQVLIFGCAYWRIADESCSATTLRRRRDEWIEAGIMDELQNIVRESYDRVIGLELGDVAVDCCITKAPRGGAKAGRSPVDRGKRGLKRSMAVDAKGIPLGVLAAPANCHDSLLLAPTLDLASESVGAISEEATIHLDRGYDSNPTRKHLKERGLRAEISRKGKSAPIQATKRWVIERTNSWSNAHKKLVWCTERVGRVVDFWISFSNAIIIAGRLIREAWSRYRWESRPDRCP